jgi:rhodanese-related sulfurtransferase
MRQIRYAQLRRLLDARAQLVEVLPEREFADEHLPGARSIPLKGWTLRASVSSIVSAPSSATAGTACET